MSIKINNNISIPSKGKINNYFLDIEKICFIIKNNYLYSIEKKYDIKIDNPFSIEKDNIIIIKIKIPKFFYSLDYSFELNNFIEKMIGSINIKASNTNFNFLLSTDENTIIVKEYCGWINIDLKYIINTNIYDIYDISYSLCFEPFKVKVIKSNCSRNITTIPLDIENNLILVNCDLSVNDINDIEVQNGDEITPIVSSSFDIESYIWYGPENFTINSEKLLIDDNIVSGIYTLKVTDIYGCVVEKSFELTKTVCEEIIATYYKDDKRNIIIEITQPTDLTIEYEYELDEDRSWNNLVNNKISPNIFTVLKLRYKNNPTCIYTVQEQLT